MGGNMTKRLLGHGHDLVVYSRTRAQVEAAVEIGARPADSLQDFDSKLEQPRAVWMMIPAGEPTESTTIALAEILSPGDIVLDGGNSNYKDSMRRANFLAERGISFLDVGTSGGVWGLTEGYSMMVGGEAAVVEQLRPIFESLAPAPDKGWGHVGPNGAGHYVKMVHNGIEYGMMQAYAEGFEILKAKGEFSLDLHQTAEIWRYGSVIRSWLLDLTAIALEEDPDLSGIQGWVADSGEGRWTINEAIDLDIPAPVITLSLFSRFTSRQEESFAAKILAAMRNQFGGHAVKETNSITKGS
jgi:6-phosphogluconate dehydrogenase